MSYTNCLDFHQCFEVMYNHPTKWGTKVTRVSCRRISETVICSLNNGNGSKITASPWPAKQHFAVLRGNSFKLWGSELSGAGNWLSVDGLSKFPSSSWGGLSESSFLSLLSLGSPPLPSLEMPLTKSGWASTPTRLRCSCTIWILVKTQVFK